MLSKSLASQTPRYNFEHSLNVTIATETRLGAQNRFFPFFFFFFFFFFVGKNLFLNKSSIEVSSLFDHLKMSENLEKKCKNAAKNLKFAKK